MQGYVKKNKELEILLATNGYTEKYSGYPDATKIRRAFEKDHRIKNDEKDPKSLEISENNALLKMATDILNDINSQPDKLINMILGVLSYQEIKNLGLESLLSSPNDESENDELKRLGTIHSLSFKLAGYFLNRTFAIDAIRKEFLIENNIQVIGSSQTKGKTILALKYATLYEDDYQIICWVNAWNEDNIYNSILKFFKIAGVEIESFERNKIKELFLSFFRVNERWLIIFDNANMESSAQKEILESYIPNSSKGHIIITTSMFKGVGGYKFHLMDHFISQDEGIKFVTDKLRMENSDVYIERLVSLSSSDLFSLHLTTSYMNTHRWMNTEIYLNLLKDYDLHKEGKIMPYMLAAFDLLCHHTHIRSAFFGCLADEGLKQALLLFLIFDELDIDFDFFSNEFPILPEPLNSFYMDYMNRGYFESMLLSYGCYFINEGIVLCPSQLKDCLKYMFTDEMKSDFCEKILDKMDIVFPIISSSKKISPSVQLYIDKVLDLVDLGKIFKKTSKRYSNVFYYLYSITED